VLVVARPVGAARIAVRMRLGVRLRVRVPGRLVRLLAVHGVHIGRRHGRRLVLVSLANEGNVTEQLRGRVTLTLIRRGRLVSRLRYRSRRELAPGSSVVIRLPYAGKAHGAAVALVRAGPRTFRYRLRL
jgi:hypothetical protein